MISGMISWERDRDPSKVLVTTSLVSELLSEHEEEYYKILAIISKMFDESEDLEEVYVFVILKDGELIIEKVCVKIIMRVNSNIFGNNGFKCLGD